MCSKKCATPLFAPSSYREPASMKTPTVAVSEPGAPCIGRDTRGHVWGGDQEGGSGTGATRHARANSQLYTIVHTGRYHPQPPIRPRQSHAHCKPRSSHGRRAQRRPHLAGDADAVGERRHLGCGGIENRGRERRRAAHCPPGERGDRPRDCLEPGEHSRSLQPRESADISEETQAREMEGYPSQTARPADVRPVTVRGAARVRVPGQPGRCHPVLQAKNCLSTESP